MGGDTTPHHFRTRILGPDLSSVTTFCAMPLGLGPGQLAAIFSDRSDSPGMEKPWNFKKQRFSHHGMSLSVRFHAVPWTSFYFLLSFLIIHRHDLFPMARSSSAQNLFSPGADLCLDRLARGYQRRFKRPYQDAQKHS